MNVHGDPDYLAAMSEYMGRTKCLKAHSPRPAPLESGYRLYSNRFCPFAKRVKIVLGRKVREERESTMTHLNQADKFHGSLNKIM